MPLLTLQSPIHAGLQLSAYYPDGEDSTIVYEKVKDALATVLSDVSTFTVKYATVQSTLCTIEFHASSEESNVSILGVANSLHTVSSKVKLGVTNGIGASYGIEYEGKIVTLC